MARVLTIMDVDLSARVLSWGAADESKEVLLSSPQIMTATAELELDNADGLISTGNQVTSLFRGKSVLDRELTVTADGILTFVGKVRDYRNSQKGRQILVMAESNLVKAMETAITFTVTSVDPGTAMLKALDEAGLLPIVNQSSFLAAGSAARAAGAVITVTIAPERDESALSLLRDISELSGISIVVTPYQIKAVAFRAYQGQESGLRQLIDSSKVRVFNDFSRSPDGFYDSCIVKYGASSSVARSRGTGGRSRTFETNTGARVSVPDLASAAFFAEGYLNRSYQKDIMSLTVDREFLDPRVGERYPVTNSHWGLSRAPMEVLETSRRLTENEVELRLASLKEE